MKKKYISLCFLLYLISLNYYSQIFPCFTQASNSPFAIQAGASSISSAVGDFNLDSKLDLALANSGLGNVSIYFGNGNGTFTLANTYTVNGNPENIIISNLNNDFYLDLITANSTNNKITILYGDTVGNFLPGSAFNNLVGGPTGLGVADFDSNGRLDIVTSNYQSDSITIYNGYTNGNFDSTKTVIKADTNMTGITVKDFNNDGKQDVAVCSNTNNRVAILLGNGNGTFNPPVYYNVGTDPQSIITLDFDNDGKFDIATANYNGTASVLFGNSNGTFSGLKNYTTQAGSAIINASDFNSDGKIDLLIGNMSSNSVTLLLGSGNGEIIGSRSYMVGSTPANVNSGDFNNDGKIDFIAVNKISNNVHVFLKNTIAQTISGSISTLNADPINGKVMIYKYYPNSTSSKLDSLDFINISNNSYSFTVADSGSYILKAVPSASSLQTTYAQSSTGWKNANIVTHGCLANSIQNFSVQAFANIGSGSGSMSGVLTQTIGFGQKPNITMAPYSPSSPGNPIGGIIIKGGKNPGGNYFSQTETDETTGTFTITGIPNTAAGESIFIFIDIPGLDTAGTYYRSFSNGESYTGLNFIVDSAKIRPAVTQNTTDVSITENGFETSLNVYPNPVNNYVNITFDLNSNSNVKIELIDILGKSILILEDEKNMTAKKYVNKYNLHDISEGAYFIKINIQDNIIYRKILITR